eukprot:Nk52_evm18s147 gene=Nk52_evmTU18s147
MPDSKTLSAGELSASTERAGGLEEEGMERDVDGNNQGCEDVRSSQGASEDSGSDSESEGGEEEEGREGIMTKSSSISSFGVYYDEQQELSERARAGSPTIALTKQKKKENKRQLKEEKKLLKREKKNKNKGKNARESEEPLPAQKSFHVRLQDRLGEGSSGTNRLLNSQINDRGLAESIDMSSPVRTRSVPDGGSNSAFAQPGATADEKLNELPGWKIALDHIFDREVRPARPRIGHIPHLLPLAYRFWRYTEKIKSLGRVPFMEPLYALKLQPSKGVPIGGIGCGTIGRGWRGEFNRWQLTPGVYSYNTVPADQFIVCVRRGGETILQQVLCSVPINDMKPKKGLGSGSSGNGPVLTGWDWNSFDGGCGEYRALYPRAYTTYRLDSVGVRLVCRQISPIVPHDYRDSSLPVGMFVWDVVNLWEEPVDVSIAFTFQNGTGESHDAKGGHSNAPFEFKGGSLSDNESETGSVNIDCVKGVRMMHKEEKEKNPYELTVASRQHSGNVSVSVKTKFVTNGDGSEVWSDLQMNGGLSSPIPALPEELLSSRKGETIGCAVCAQISLKGKGSDSSEGDPAGVEASTGELEFCLSWDMPRITFLSTSHLRWYTKFFGSDGMHGPEIACYAFASYKDWEEKIEKWQAPVLTDPGLPRWYKSALFNELYYLADGGTIWIVPDQESTMFPGNQNLSTGKHNPLRDSHGLFAYLEGHEYRMYNTYDVHFYASYALVMLWPKLQLSLQYEMAEAVDMCDFRPWQTLMRGNTCQRKMPHAVPHDVGDPGEDPWLRVNSYNIHDTSTWKDLNTKFVLQVYRDYCITGDKDYLWAMWPRMKEAIRHLEKYDRNNDGVIENDGFPDQTYDEWTVSGTSAYCGGLWLAALRVMLQVAEILGLQDEVVEFRVMYESGVPAYSSKLWNGKYFRYDDDESRGNAESIMADQCAGAWYLTACDLIPSFSPDAPPSSLPAQSDSSTTQPISPPTMPTGPCSAKDLPGYASPAQIKSALSMVFQYNVCKFAEGTMGPVNGMFPSGVPDASAMQSEEVWTGTAYSIAANMLEMGMDREAFGTASGIYNTCYNIIGMGFQTPEAFDIKGNFRALGYMRPLAIWAMQWALEKRRDKAAFIKTSAKD